ncbi:MAG: ribbon-helix-helix domain-containing protein [Candidatus Woesearchaeota archaeon]|nr:ribbon-helix-helix domain-containing protein [Candidatus Woesearchaeota archaeon]
METISLKLEENILGEIDEKLAAHRYSTRSEFIRDAIREKLSDLEKDELLKRITMLRGSSKRRTTDAQLHAAQDRAFELLEKKIKGRPHRS